MKGKVVGGLQVSNELGGGGSRTSWHSFIATCNDSRLLHNCSACGSRSVFLCKGDSVTLLFFIDVDLYYRAVCQQQHPMQTSFALLEGTANAACDHRLAASWIAALIIYPCFSGLSSSVPLLASSACWVALLSAETNHFLFQFGSSARTSLTTIEAWL